jgi:hypothetical protein
MIRKGGETVNRGYAGYYKNVYLRSSYEYAYAKYLDYRKIRWSYEQRKFDLSHKIYTPDFFVYNEKNELQFIVEIKSKNREEKRKAKEILEEVKKCFGIDYKLLSYKDLLQLYTDLPFSLTKTINEWNGSPYTTINKSIKGELNPHYNQRHSEHTKKMISFNTRKLWADPEKRKKMIAGAKKGAALMKAKKGTWIKVPRVKRTCQFCQKTFIVLETSNQRFCSDVCGGRYGFQMATEAYVSKRKEIHDKIKHYVLEWSMLNAELIRGTPFNKVNTNLSPLFKNIESQYGVKDIRVITKAVLGENLGRKSLLLFLKEAVISK